MQCVDIFNGDADGLCALHQLRLAEPVESTLVTGVKRHIRLVEGVTPPSGSAVTVLDISLAENAPDVQRLLAHGCRIRYFDHHYPGELPAHEALETHIDTAADTCTALIVDRALGGTYRAWAVAAAFGDNLGEAARRAADPLGLGEPELEALRDLGELLNYNGYGESLRDLHFHPAELYRAVQPYGDPLAFYRKAPEAEALHRGFAGDLAQAGSTSPVLDEAPGRVYLLPDEAWARRVMGVLANRLANETPGRATAVGVENTDGTLRLSVRAPLERPRGTDALCRQFPTGGGRAGAGGINSLPRDQLDAFLDAFRAAFQG